MFSITRISLLFVASCALAADAKLEIAHEAGSKTTGATLRPASAENVIVYKEPGRYGGWPANHGLWQWGDELVAGFTATWYRETTTDHRIDRTKPSYEIQARSLDGGKTWKTETELPFADPKAEAKPTPLKEPLDFTAPDFALMFRFGSLHAGPSWFYTTTDRCRTWHGPYSFAVEGVEGICTRTDLIVLGPKDCLMFGSCGKKNDGKEGRVFCARTTDGALTWKLVSFIGDEPPAGDFAIMPSTVRLPSGALLTTIRRGKPGYNVELWRSDDLGQHWARVSDVTGNIGGNPPATVLLPDGRLCVTYGFRRKPTGIRARISSDEGRTWAPEVIVRDDGFDGDLGYPRSIVRPDGKVLTVYYYNGPRGDDRAIEGTFWTAPASSAQREGTTNSIGMKLVAIAPGHFTMGQDGPAEDYRMTRHPEEFDHADWDEKPAHQVTITRPFQIGATEVTVGQWRQFRPEFRPEADPENAVTGVTWNDAVEFCAWLSKKEGRTYRLPTEAEWEYACRAGTTTRFHTGDALPAGFQKWFRDDNRRSLYFAGPTMPPEYRRVGGTPSTKVAQTPPNAWGLYDMHGNVAEWCADWYGPYEAGEQTDPLSRSAGDFRVIRGGSHSSLVRLLRSANRAAWIPESRNDSTGFRVVLADNPAGHALPPAAAPLNAQKVDQSLPKIEATAMDAPFFSGPKPFVKIPPNSVGPMFSWHNHSPAITECPNGDLLAAWYSCADEAGTELCNLASRLRRGAQEWEPASPFWDGADVNDHAPKLWWDGGRTLFHLARGFAENIVRTSTDSGATWTKARILQPHGEFGNQLIRLHDGTLVISHDSRQASLVFSHDGGKTWSFNDVAQRQSDFRAGGTGFRYPGIHAPLVELLDGRIMAISRNDKPEDQAKFHGRTPISYTSDLGKTWTYAESEFPAISMVQRQVLLRLREGPILLCSFTDQRRDWDKRQGMKFKAADGHEFTGYGLFAAVSFDDGKTWPARRLITPGGAERTEPSIDRNLFTLSDTMAESAGYLAVTQTRDGKIQLISSKNHYVFNLAWLKALPDVR